MKTSLSFTLFQVVSLLKILDQIHITILSRKHLQCIFLTSGLDILRMFSWNLESEPKKVVCSCSLLGLLLGRWLLVAVGVIHCDSFFCKLKTSEHINSMFRYENTSQKKKKKHTFFYFCTNIEPEKCRIFSQISSVPNVSFLHEETNLIR